MFKYALIIWAIGNVRPEAVVIHQVGEYQTLERCEAALDTWRSKQSESRFVKLEGACLPVEK